MCVSPASLMIQAICSGNRRGFTVRNGANAHRAEPEFHVAGAVPRQRGDAVARLHAILKQGCRDLTGAGRINPHRFRDDRAFDRAETISRWPWFTRACSSTRSTVSGQSCIRPKGGCVAFSAGSWISSARAIAMATASLLFRAEDQEFGRIIKRFWRDCVVPDRPTINPPPIPARVLPRRAIFRLRRDVRRLAVYFASP